MRYTLRTLLIALAVLPALPWVAWKTLDLFWEWLLWSIGPFGPPQ